MKNSKTFLFLLCLFLTNFLFVLGLWTVDVSFTTQNLNGVMFGLFGSRSPMSAYHIGLGLSIISYTIINLVMIVLFNELSKE